MGICLNNPDTKISEDLIVQLLHPQIKTLSTIIMHIKAGNTVNDYIDENVKQVGLIYAG